jgi:pyruvate dehydrogenase (quinone)
MAHSVADHLVATLKASGVRRLYGLPGDSLNGLTDAIRRDGEVTWEHVRHEEAAAFAAAADAALTGELAVAVGSCGPGNLHLINGLYDANRSRVPVLAIAAHIPGAEIGGQYFQATHPEELFREASVYCELISTPEQAPHIIEMAMRAAIEKQGVAVVVIPGEVLLADSVTKTVQAITRTRSVIRPDDASLAEAARLIGAGKRVTILAGAGVKDARDEVLALASTLGAPIVHALRGKEWIEHDNPYDVGMTGLLGFASGYRAMEHCDTLLMLGTDFPYRQFFPSKATIIQVDVRGENIGRRAPVDLALVGTVKDTVAALLPMLPERADTSHLDDSVKHYRQTRKHLDELAEADGDVSPVYPEYVMRRVDALAADDAVFTVDVGSPTTWVARYLHGGPNRRLIGSFSHGSMAGALPHAMGAQTVDRSRQVVALAGDGGLAMSFGELLSLVQNRLNVKIVVFDNSSLNFVELEMKAAGIVNFGTELVNPDFAAVATAIGLHGERVERPSELDAALRRAFAHDGPALIDVVTARQELSIPPAISAQQAAGFSLWGIRTILSGRGDELVDLVDTNVIRRLLKR